MNCENGTHEKVVFDRFAKDFQGSRKIPGDCYCMDCHSPIPAWWNSGRPVAIKEEDLKDN